MSQLRSLVYLNVKALKSRFATDKSCENREFCLAFSLLRREVVLNSSDTKAYHERVKNILCMFIYYEDLVEREEKEDFLLLLRQEGFEQLLDHLRQDRYQTLKSINTPCSCSECTNPR